MARTVRWQRSAVLVVLAVASVGLVTPGAYAAPAPDKACRAANAAGAAVLSQVQSAVGPHLDANTPGVSLAIIAADPDAPRRASAAIINCGVTASGATEPTTSDTVYELGSESKLFTATALAQLVRRGAVSLETTLQSLLGPSVPVPTAPCQPPGSPPPPPPGAAITLGQLGTHNSGLADSPYNTTWTDNDPQGHQAYSRADLYQSFTQNLPSPCQALLFTPGTAWSYSNWGYALLGTVLADTYAPSSGVPNYATLIADLVTGPLGMADTVLEPIPPTPAMATPTCPTGVAQPCYWDNVNAYAGGGGLVSTIADMATFTTASLGFDRNPAIWPALAMTQQPRGYGPRCPNPPDAPTCQGLAWQITQPGQEGSIGPFPILDKDGGTWGMNSHTYLLPAACWGITLLSNSNQNPPLSVQGFAGTLIKELSPTHSLCAPRSLS